MLSKGFILYVCKQKYSKNIVLRVKLNKFLIEVMFLQTKVAKKINLLLLVNMDNML